MFRRILIGTWLVYLAVVALVFISPKGVFRFFSLFGLPDLTPVGYALPILLLITAIYAICRVFRAGMAGPTRRGDTEGRR